jgi:hypothetical protein
MSMMKNLMFEFCAVIYPDDWERQMNLLDHFCTGEVTGYTIESFREEYEKTNQCPDIALDDIIRLVKEFHESGQIQTAPALTVRNVLAMLKAEDEPRKET